MKRLFILLSAVLLVSCSEGSLEETYFDTSRTLYITYTDSEVSFSGTLAVSGECFTFTPDSPKGLTISFEGEEGEVSYNGKVFEGSVADTVRIKKVFDAIKEGSARFEFDKKSRLLEIEDKNFNIKVHKEETK